MGSCAAPSAKGDDKFITTDYLQQCRWIDPGKTGKASIDTLCGYVWPSEASGSTMRKRRQRVREALPELVALGWTVTEFAAGKYDITRPKAAG